MAHKDFAIIQGGKVVNVVVIDDADAKTIAALGAVLLPAGAVVGWLYDGVNFTDPAYGTLAAAQATQIGILFAAYQNATQQPVAFTNAAGTAQTYQADDYSQGVVAKMLDAYRGTLAVPAGFYWKALDNTQVPFTYADLQGLAAAMGAQGWTAFQHWQTQKAAVAAATTVAQVQAVIW